MSNTISTIVHPTELTFPRTSKAGKVAVRGFIGLMTSGNVSERRSAADALVMYHFDHGQYKPVLNEFARVFAGKDFTTTISVLGVDMAKPNKVAMLALLGALVRGTAGKTLKGEKATYRCYAVDIVARADAAQAVREAAKSLGVSDAAMLA